MSPSVAPLEAACCGTDPWLDWVETGMDFFGCDGTSAGGNDTTVFGRAALMLHKPQHHDLSLSSAYESSSDRAGGGLSSSGSGIGIAGTCNNKSSEHLAKQHDAFIEALLAEQLHQHPEFGRSSSNNIPLSRQQSSSSSLMAGDNDSLSSGLTMGSSSVASSVTQSTVTTTTHRDADDSNTIGGSSSMMSISSLKTHKKKRRRPASISSSSSAPANSSGAGGGGLLSSSSASARFFSSFSSSGMTTTTPRTGGSSKVAPMEIFEKKYGNGNGNHQSNNNSNHSRTSSNHGSNHSRTSSSSEQPPPQRQLSQQGDDNATINLQDIFQADHESPESMLHPAVQLQKDKARGERIGSAVSAEGIEACKIKLDQKMQLLLQVAMEDRKGLAGMKRRPAKVSEETARYTETRSIMELRLGFLSMQYGVLLRWDVNTEKIVFIVLRKMCHDSFYTKLPKNKSSGGKTKKPPLAARAQPQGAAGRGITRATQAPPPLVVRDGGGNHAIYQRPFGTEVALVEPPYLIDQPRSFRPGILSVKVTSVSALSRRSRWTMSMTFHGQTEVTQLNYSPDHKRFVARREGPMEWELAPWEYHQQKLASSNAGAGYLEIRLFEQKRSKRRSSHSRLAATMTLPLGKLVSQPSTMEASSWQLVIPSAHDPKNCKIQLSLQHQSEYSHWLYQELSARQRQELNNSSSSSYWFRRGGDHSDGEDGDDEYEEYDLLADACEWLCLGPSSWCYDYGKQPQGNHNTSSGSLGSKQ